MHKLLRFAFRYFDINPMYIITKEKSGSWVLPHKDFFQFNFDPKSVKLQGKKETAFHEATHVKQYLKDGLSLNYSGKASFRGKEFQLDDELHYWELPWEVEARGMEEALKDVYRRRDKKAREIRWDEGVGKVISHRDWEEREIRNS